MRHLCLALFGAFSEVLVHSCIIFHEHIVFCAFVLIFMIALHMRENFSLAKQRCFFILKLSLWDWLVCCSLVRPVFTSLTEVFWLSLFMSCPSVSVTTGYSLGGIYIFLGEK